MQTLFKHTPLGHFIGFEVIAAVTMKNIIWNVTRENPTSVHWRFGGTSAILHVVSFVKNFQDLKNDLVKFWD
jgi:hypothetical protein